MANKKVVPAVTNAELVKTEPQALALAALDAAIQDPVSLVEAMRYLQQKVPGYVVMTARERRSSVNQASLPPELIDIGIQALATWPEGERLVKCSAGEALQLRNEIQRWDEVERQFLAVAKGIADANLRRKRELGGRILQLYRLLPAFLRGEEESYLRPFYEQMKAIYQKRRNKRRKKEEEPE